MKHTAHIRPRARGFASDEDGAVTVDWIVLTGVIVFMGLAAAFFVGAKVPGLAENISEYMMAQPLGD